MSTPKVSVLLPNYNYARFLPDAIESVLAQSFTDFEFLLSDDGSQDESRSLLQHYAQLDPRIRVISPRTRLGMVAHWNWCMEAARGDYVKYVFGDDCLATGDALERQVRALESHPTATLATAARLVIDPDSRPLDLWRPLTGGLHAGSAMITRCLEASENLIGEPTAVLFRRRSAARGFDPTWRQIVDQEFWFHLLRQGDLVVDVAPLAGFRLHPLQQTAVNRKARVGDVETLQLLTRYWPDLVAAKFSPSRRARIVFDCLHRWERDGRPTTFTAQQARDSLRAHVNRREYWSWWIQRRLRRPWENARQSWRKRVRRWQPSAPPEPNWRPLRIQLPQAA